MTKERQLLGLVAEMLPIMEFIVMVTPQMPVERRQKFNDLISRAKTALEECDALAP